LRDAAIDVRPSVPAGDSRPRVVASATEVVVRNSSLRELVALAYGVEPFRVTGGGIWLDDVRYDVRAIVGQGVSEPEDFEPTALRGVVTRLLGSRFDLEIHVNQQCQQPCGRDAAALAVAARH
jgi:uncharacterized protein (TIGR03435 family)